MTGRLIDNTLGHTLLAQPGTAQRFSPMSFIIHYLGWQARNRSGSLVRAGGFSAMWNEHWKLTDSRVNLGRSFRDRSVINAALMFVSPLRDKSKTFASTKR
jgi:hypothetical protein